MEERSEVKARTQEWTRWKLPDLRSFILVSRPFFSSSQFMARSTMFSPDIGIRSWGRREGMLPCTEPLQDRQPIAHRKHQGTQLPRPSVGKSRPELEPYRKLGSFRVSGGGLRERATNPSPGLVYVHTVHTASNELTYRDKRDTRLAGLFLGPVLGAKGDPRRPLIVSIGS
ncbi:hypothetical protein LIA77_06500 [Sarocladium implicatum]|nr:hypothetical protein LIA77_06500 [Sarocladium implicatum]